MLQGGTMGHTCCEDANGSLNVTHFTGAREKPQPDLQLRPENPGPLCICTVSDAVIWLSQGFLDACHDQDILEHCCGHQ